MSWLKNSYCPACGHEALFVPGREADDGVIRCTATSCPEPDAVAKILADRELHHIVRFVGDQTNVQHPLQERIDHRLLGCRVLPRILRDRGLYGSPFTGEWRVRMADVNEPFFNWIWERL